MKNLTKATLVVTTAAALAGFAYVQALSPRRGHPGWEELAAYRYAHRGLHDLSDGRPENSLPAFRAAVEHGFGAELDVHLMRDGSLAVVHDSCLTRVTGADVTVEDLTAEDLKSYPLTGSDETIPLLEDVLDVFSGQTPLIIELKTHNGNAAALTDAVMERLADYGGPYCLESFDPHVLLCLRDRYPDVIRGQLSENFLRSRPASLNLPLRAAMTHLLTTFRTKPDFIAYNHVDRGALSLRLMKTLYGVHEVSWTVRDPELQKKLEREGVQTIFEGFIPE